ncbi:MAG: PRC-barrel domain containing protein [Nitrospiraceae bacterium]|nr:MAG: PRC-barrel domain containing protein [Nitrospiraceae bacterium]
MKRIITMLVIVILTLGLSGAYAADMMKGKSFIKGSKLMDADVENRQGEKLGKISDLVFDSRDNRVTFAVLSHGGVLGIGDKLIAVPITALTFKDEDTVILDINKDKLAAAPNFESSKWPDMSNRQWIDETYRYYGISPKFDQKGTEKTMDEMKKDTTKGKSTHGY